MAAESDNGCSTGLQLKVVRSTGAGTYVVEHLRIAVNTEDIAGRWVMASW